MAFEHAVQVDSLWDGEMYGLRLAGRRVLITKIDGAIKVYEDRCPHLGAPLSQGRMHEGVITCAAHQFQYDGRTGQGVNPQRSCLLALPFRIEGGAVLVDAGDTTRAQAVGPVLESGEIANAIIAAVRELNRDVRIEDRGAYVRVLVPERCIVTRVAIEHVLGRAFSLPTELERTMPSFKGRLTINAEEATWAAR